MRNPTDVLRNLRDRAKDKTYRFQRLYRNLYNPEFYLLAYQRIYANAGSMTPGVDGTTMDGMGAKRIAKVIALLQDQNYQPKPARRTYIAKKNNPAKKRPLGIPSGEDKIVQEVVRMLLEAIYEPVFSPHSHGFRPNRSCHTALMEIQRTCTGTVWFVEGDITACFDSFDHHILIDLLRKRIDDEKFIALMWKFLKAGYVEQWRYHTTYSGTPQGSGVSPILANIYLHELDAYMDAYQTKFAVGAGSPRQTNPPYKKATSEASHYKRKYANTWETLSEEERNQHAKELRALNHKARQIPSRLFRDTLYKNIRYVRYADDFLICVTGSKSDAEQVKSDVGAFLSGELHLTLSEEKTKVTHSSERARFLSYDITVSRSQSTKRDKNGIARRVFSGNIMLYVPHEKWAAKLKEHRAIRTKRDDQGRDHWYATHRGDLITRSDIDILHKYNSEVRGLFLYYCIANNASVLGKFGGLMKHSMLKTFAGKYRTQTTTIRKRYTQNGDFVVPYLTKSGMKQALFYNGGFARKTSVVRGLLDTLPIHRHRSKGSQLVGRIKAGTCELCGATACETEVHQVKRLKDLTGRHPWELVMMDKRRKTLVVCPGCHEKIHSTATS